MSISQAVNGDTADHIKVFGSVCIIEIAALALNESDREEVEYLKTIVFVEILDQAEIIFYTHNVLFSPLRSLCRYRSW